MSYSARCGVNWRMTNILFRCKVKLCCACIGTIVLPSLTDGAENLLNVFLNRPSMAIPARLVQFHYGRI